MQHRKLYAAIIAVLVVGIVAPISIPRVHADDQSENLSVTGYTIRNYGDPYIGHYVDAATAGSTLTFTLAFAADNGNFQRNVTMGVKFDWMSTYQNTSSQAWIAANQIVYIQLNYTLPTLTGGYSTLGMTSHSWHVQVWDTAQGKTWTSYGCFDTGTISCRDFYYWSVGDGNPLAIYTSAQANSVLTRQQANAEIIALRTTLGSVLPPAGSSAAVADLAQANAQLAEGDVAYQQGNFNTAQTDYNNALNNANAAQSSLATIGGGTDTATMTSIWIDTVAVFFGGLGALLVGIAGFKYLRGKTRSMQGYSPSTTSKS